MPIIPVEKRLRDKSGVSTTKSYEGVPCLEWSGSRHKRGYGEIRVDGKTRKAHVVAWELVNRPVPEGRELDHLCRNEPCIEVRHLDPVTHRENVLRGEGIAAKNARKTHCPQGHAFTPENTRIERVGKGTGRRCVTCERARTKRSTSR